MQSRSKVMKMRFFKDKSIMIKKINTATNHLFWFDIYILKNGDWLLEETLSAHTYKDAFLKFEKKEKEFELK